MSKSPRKKIARRALIIFLILIVVIQFFRIDKTVPEFDPAHDLIAVTNPSDEVQQLLKSACYDCHSYETNYPWYSNIAPVSWMVGNHIEEGREHLNFSIWSEYDLEKAAHKLEECEEEVEEGEMPIKGYTITHSEAKLSSEQKETLEEWFKEERQKLLDK